MAPKKGVSAGEKTKRALEFFMETQTVWSLKELESKLSKEKGIVSMTVKDLIQSLVDDNLIDKDKIGSGNYFWSFPSKTITARQNRIDLFKSQVTANKKTLEDMKERKRKNMIGREQTDDRVKKLARLEELRATKRDLTEKLNKYASTDPERIKQLESGIEVCKVAANRWTENVMTLMSYFKQNGFCGEATDEQILANFNLPPDLDTLP